jgi:predicted O-linked N-acetylglucosamine transferase (SPINDLY family)
LAESAAAFRAAIALRGNYPQAHCGLANAMREMGQLDDALTACRAAIRLSPRSGAAHTVLGNVLADQGKPAEALAAFDEAIRCEPGLVVAHYNRGNALWALGRLDEAVAAYGDALRIDPRMVLAHCNLGNVLKDQGELDRAVACFDRAIALQPNNPILRSNRIYTLHFHPGYGPAALLAEQRAWDERHGRPLAGERGAHANTPEPGRRLRVGYVSPNLRWHPVGRFVLTLLEHHDHATVEVFCYSDVRETDDVTARFRAASDVWRETARLGDAELAEQIRADRIDVLVDLTMHMGRNRLPVFARKPAPVQMTYMAYLSGTGLEAMDYRLSDPYLDPPGTHEGHYVEWTVPLAETYWCLRPGDGETPDVGPLPARATGFVTFGCLNNFCKVTAPTLEAWCRIMGAVAGSRLLLHAAEGSHRQRVADVLARAGIDPGSRLRFVGSVSPAEYFRLHHEIDVALDPFPHGGGMTSFDALWMGLPLVTLAGETGVSRMGYSFLSNVGLAELAAHRVEDYVPIAVELARDLARLETMRAGLRGRLLNSPLTDGARFARNVEAAYRWMWEQWCAKQSRGAGATSTKP